MKRIQKILITCLMIMICLSQPAYASKAKKGSLTTTYPCAGIEVQLYHVANEGKNSKFILEDRFSQYPIGLTNKTKMNGQDRRKHSKLIFTGTMWKQIIQSRQTVPER